MPSELPHRLVRPQDLVVLDIAWQGMSVADGVLAVDAGAPGGLLILGFPPQHLREQAFFKAIDVLPVPADDPDAGAKTEVPTVPVQSRLSNPSRLVFVVPAGEVVPLDLSGILSRIRSLRLLIAPPAWSPTEPATVEPAPMIEEVAGLLPIARAPRATAQRVHARRRIMDLVRAEFGFPQQSWEAADHLFRPSPGVGIPVASPTPMPPGPTHTSIEVPSRLVLSPNQHGAWFHRIDPFGGSDGRFELWHTRLATWPHGSTSPDDRVPGLHPLRTVRAIWSRDRTRDGALTTPPEGQAVVVPDPGNPQEPDRSSLDAFDRHNIVHLSSNTALTITPHEVAVPYRPIPIGVSDLALTALGATLDLRGTWDEQPQGLSVLEWRHRAAVGRDQVARVVYAGRLFPFGHRASLVKVTERQFTHDGGAAFLRQRMFIVVREPTRTFGAYPATWQPALTQADGTRIDRMLPWDRITITTITSPDLDDPASSPRFRRGAAAKLAFLPRVDGRPFRFACRATDRTGGTVDFDLPLLFLDKVELDRPIGTGAPGGSLPSILPAIVADYGPTKTMVSPHGITHHRITHADRVAPLGGQSVAWVDTAPRPGATDAVADASVRLPTQSITFEARLVDVPGTNAEASRHARFLPVVSSGRVSVPALDHLSGRRREADVEYWPSYLASGWTQDAPGEVFLRCKTPLVVAFSPQSNQTGALAAPDLRMVGLSRAIGPVSGSANPPVDSLGTVNAGEFDPTDAFGDLLDARLLGSIRLSSILEAATVSAAPVFTGGTMTVVDRATAVARRIDAAMPSATTVGPSASAILQGVLEETSTASAAIAELTGLTKSASRATQAQVDQLAALLDEVVAALPSYHHADPGLPTRDVGSLSWAAPLKPAFSDGALELQADHPLEVVVDVVGGDGDHPPEVVTTAVLEGLHLTLAGIVGLDFDRLEFRSRAGRKPEVDVVFDDIRFEGPLQFVDVLRKYIPLDGFSDPPAVDVSSSGIVAAFGTTLPTLAVGAFSIQQLGLDAGFGIPFTGDPLYAWFNFASRERPAMLTVGLFGGGAHVGVSVHAAGLRSLEVSLEFGAAVAMNLGMAAGSVSAMGGIHIQVAGTEVQLTGYFRVRGVVKALGIVSISIELYLGLAPSPSANNPKRLTGTAQIWVEVDIGFASKDIRVEASKSFGGSSKDPPFAEMVKLDDWQRHWAAFA